MVEVSVILADHPAHRVAGAFFAPFQNVLEGATVLFLILGVTEAVLADLQLAVLAERIALQRAGHQLTVQASARVASEKTAGIGHAGRGTDTRPQ